MAKIMLIFNKYQIMMIYIDARVLRGQLELQIIVTQIFVLLHEAKNLYAKHSSMLGRSI